MAGSVSCLHQRCGMLLGCMLWVLCGCILPLTSALSSSGPLPASITAITFERNCFGCAAGGLLVLRRDGSATFTVTGNARQGSQDKVFQGSISVEAFDKLAQLTVSQGFFALNDTYEDPQIRDGAWVMLGVARGGLDKRVFRREDAGPASLTVLEAAIEAIRAQIKFAP